MALALPLSTSFVIFFLLGVFVFPLLWLIVFTKKLFFWVWLWQLKDYHFWRFIDHFRIHKGKKIILNWLNLIKLICLLGLFLDINFFLYVLFLIFFSEAVLTFYHLARKNFRAPKRTPKTIIILLTGLCLEYFLFFFIRNRFGIEKEFFSWLLLIDLSAPIIFSLLILALQPLTILWRNREIKKAKKKRKQFKDLIVIGIAGSYGKSSTKEFLYQILSQKFSVLKTKENVNSEIGISQTILNNLNTDYQIFICEMGAYRQGGIKLLADIAKPKIGILTGLNEQHLATFGSQEKIIKTKFELIKALPENGTAIVNYDNQLIIQNLKSDAIRCSLQDIEGLEVGQSSIFFKIKDTGFKVNLAGKQNVINLLLAIKCGQEIGMDLPEISQAIAEIKPFRKTMELKQGKEGVQIIDDTYSANPKGVMAGLEHLKLWPGKKIIVMPCLIELGRASEKVHQEIGENIGRICDLAIIITKDKFSEMKKSAVSAGMKQENIIFLENPNQIFEKLKPYLKPENVILLESRVPEKLIELLSA